MIPANLRLMLSLRFSGKNAGVAQETSENKPDPRTGHAREGVRHPKHRLAARAAIRPQRVLEEPAAEPEQGHGGNDGQNDHVGVERRTITLDGTLQTTRIGTT